MNSTQKLLNENDHLASLKLKKEALCNVKKIKNYNDRSSKLLEMLNELNAVKCDCDNCRNAEELIK